VERLSEKGMKLVLVAQRRSSKAKFIITRQQHYWAVTNFLWQEDECFLALQADYEQESRGGHLGPGTN
jgi:hypothetical protein